MKFSSVFAVLSVSSSALAGPLLSRAAEAGADALAKRAPIDDAYGIVQSLYTQVQTYTGAMNASVGGVSAASDQQTKDTTVSSVGENINSITAAVNDAKAQVDAISSSDSKKLMARQSASPDALAALVENLLLEISGALNAVIGPLGLAPLLGYLSPLVASLSGLLLALKVVVDQLLLLVKQLLDGLLVGLSIGLIGLPL